MGARFFALLGSVLLLVAAGLPARAQAESACTTPSALTQAEFELSHLGRSLREKTPTTILVLNSSAKAKPAANAGADAIPRRFPNYVEEALRARYPNGGVRVVTRNEPGLTAEGMLGVLPGVLSETRPALVIWQTGTHDAIRGVDLDTFASAIGVGIGMARAANTDILVMSPQYSPRTEFAFDTAPYNATLRWASRTNGALFFDRYALMHYWADEDIFALDELRPDPALFENVHRCIGRLLVTMIVNGVTPRTLGSR